MKRFIALFFVFALLVTAFIFSSPRSQAQAGLVSAVLQRMEGNYNSLKTLKSNVTVVKYTGQTREQEQTDGYLYLVPQKGRKANFRFDIQSPAQEYIVVKDANYTYYKPKINTAYVGKTASQQGGSKGTLFSFLSMSGAQLQASYGVQVAGNENVWSPKGDVPTTKLFLTPKTRNSYKFAEVWVDGNGMPLQIKITEQNNDWTAIRVFNVDRNSNFDSNSLVLQLPKTVKTIKG